MRSTRVVTLISPFVFGNEGSLSDGLRLRLIGLYEGLKKNGISIFFASPMPDRIKNLTNEKMLFWRNESELKSIVENSDVIISSYAYLGFNRLLLNMISDRQFLITDGLVPIFLENQSVDRLSSAEVMDCKNFLQRSDVILVSSESVAKYYSALIKDETIGDFTLPEFVICPFGVRSEDYLLPKINRGGSLNLLWYGGVYPWLGVDHLVDFIEYFPKRNDLNLTLIGIENPYATDKVLLATTQRILDAVKNKANVRVLPWLPNNDRLEFLNQFDGCVFFNDPLHPETNVSWRTRYSDLMLAGVPLVVNEFDPLSRELVSLGTAIVKQEIYDSRLMRAPGFCHELRYEMDNLKKNGGWANSFERYSITQVAAPLARLLTRLINQ